MYKLPMEMGPLDSIIPDDENVVISTNQGEPLVGSDTPAGCAYMNISKRVMGEEIPFMSLEKKLTFFTKVSTILSNKR